MSHESVKNHAFTSDICNLIKKTYIARGFVWVSEAIVQGWFVKKVLLIFSQNSSFGVSFSIKLKASLLKKRLRQRRFPANFRKVLKISFLWTTYGGCFFDFSRLFGQLFCRTQANGCFWVQLKNDKNSIDGKLRQII